MMKWVHYRWHVPIAAALLLYSAVLYAQSELVDRHDVPTWEMLVPYLAGLAVVAITAYARGLSGRISAIEKDISVKKADSNRQIDTLKERMLTQYHDAQEIERIIRSAIAPIETKIMYVHKELAKIDAIHARLDRLNVPRAHIPQDNGE